MPIFLLTFPSFAKQGPLCWRGEGCRHSIPSLKTAQDSLPVLQQARPLSQVGTLGGQDGLLNVCILNPKHLSHLLQAASDHRSIFCGF